MTKDVFTGRAINTQGGNLLVTCTINQEQFIFYMSPEGKLLISKTQITGKVAKVTPQEFAWAKNGFGTNIPSKVNKLNELQMEYAKKIVFEIKKDSYFGFSEEQIEQRKESLKKILKNLSTAV